MGYPSETRIKPGRNDTTEKSGAYVEIARSRFNDLAAGTLRYRSLGKPVYQPTGKEKVSQVPQEWLNGFDRAKA